MKTLLATILLLFSYSYSFCQSPILVSIVGNNLVYHHLSDNRIKYVPLSSNIFTSEVPRSIDYNPDECIYYIITNFRSTPKLYTVTHLGDVTSVGTLAPNNGQAFYSCEAIAYSEYTKKTYVSVSYPNGDYYTETIAEINTNNAVFTPITTINTNLPRADDADFMECYGTSLIISDNNVSPSYTTLFSLDLTNIGTTSNPTSIYYSDAFINFQELTVINDKVYVEEAKRLYQLDLTASTKTFAFVQNLSYTGFNGTSTAMTSFNNEEIFDNITLHNDTVICDGDSIEIDPSDLSEFTWSDGSTGVKAFKTSGNYFGTSKVGSCLFSTDTFNITIEPCDTCSIHFQSIDTNNQLTLNDTILCEGDSLKIGIPIIPNWNITWNTGSTQDSITIKFPGSYYAFYSYGDCTFRTKIVEVGFESCDSCDFKLQRTIDYFKQFENIALCIGDSFVLRLPSFIDSVSWSNGGNVLNRTFKEATEIQGLVFVDTCSYQTVPFNLNFYSCKECSIYLPNAFTPDNNTLNEVFRPIFSPDCAYSIESFQIFNRWGEKLLDSDTAVWDGTYEQEKCQMDVYIYLLSVKYTVGNTVERYNGNVHLVR